MTTHRLTDTSADFFRRLVPFGLAAEKPQHFRDMARIVWENRDNLPYAMTVLTQGVCDGCALGVAGLYDWTIDGVHLCTTRLNLLRLNTMPALDVAALADIEPLRRLSNRQLRNLGRLPYPMLRRRGERGFARIDWDAALDLVADRINASTPERIAFFLTSRGITNEVYYVAQKVARFLGTNNVDNAARLCHSPSTGAMRATLGVAASTCSYKDWFGTDLIVFFGSNPANDQPVAMKYLDQAKRMGSKIVLVNPYLEPGMRHYWVPSSFPSAIFGTPVSDYWFPVAQGGDIAFCLGVIKHIIENGWQDERFVREHATGFDELAASARAAEWDLLEKQSGLTRHSMLEMARLIARAKTGVFIWSMGITQHGFGGDAVQSVLNLGLMKGFVGRDQCGLMPIRGHSGVQGGAEMGAYATAFPGGKTVNAENARWLSEQYGFDVPDKPGLTGPEMVEAAGRGELDLLYSLGGNFLRTLPDPDYVAGCLSRAPLRVHQDIILTDQVFIDPADTGEAVLLLPAKTRYEQDGGGTETTTERRVCFSPELTRQVGEARAEWQILRQVAERSAERKVLSTQLGTGKSALSTQHSALPNFACATGQQIREEIARVVPSYEGVQRLRTTGDAFQYGGPHLCAGWRFPTPDGKAHFRPVPLPSARPAAGQFHCSTRRGKQFNTLIYAEIDPLNGAPRDAVLIGADDAAELHLKHGDRVSLTSDVGTMEATVHLAPIARGNVQVHWPEGNVILHRDKRDPTGGVPDYNAAVRIERISR